MSLLACAIVAFCQVPDSQELNEGVCKTIELDGIRVHQQSPSARLKDGATIPLGNGNHLLVDVPEIVSGRRFTQRDGYQGKLSFDVLESQTVFLALYGQDWGGGGNPSGNWQPEVTSRQRLEKQGWKPIGFLPVQHSDPNYSNEAPWVLFSRNCEIGESFLIRNHKYQAPLLIWGKPSSVDD